MVTITPQELEEVLHAIRKISRKIVTARELIDEVSEEFEKLCTLAHYKAGG